MDTILKTIREQITECKSTEGKNKLLSGSDLRCADLRCADLSGSDLSGSDLRGAHLRCADLSGSDLSGSDLRGAHLRCADLSGADLSGSDLSGSDLRGSDLSGAHLSGAHLRCCGKWNVRAVNGKIGIGCKNMSLEQWDSFFSGCDEMETKRGTFDFFEIEHNYQWFKRLLQEYPEEFGVIPCAK